MTETVDAVVIGAGHNGLVAANMLADAGWDVVVLEGTDHVGGAVRSAQITAPSMRELRDLICATRIKLSEEENSALSDVTTVQDYRMELRHA